MKHNSNLAPSRKASCERSLLLLMIAFVIGLCSCGIRPLNRPDNNISGLETTYLEETDPPETDEETKKPIREPITMAPESYPHEYNPFGGTGTGVDPHSTLSYLTDEAYIKDHTVGFFYIKNKGKNQYLTSKNILWYSSLSDEQKFDHLQILHGIDNATIFQMIELDKGYYAFISPNTYTRSYDRQVRRALTLSQSRVNQGCPSPLFPSLYNLWAQSFIVKETKSGAYTLTTRLMDYYTDCVIGIARCSDGDFSYYTMFYNGPYTDDDDYSDEWLFIPAEPPETEAP